MSTQERIVAMERRLSQLETQLQRVSSHPQNHGPMHTRPARVTAQPSSVGKTFRIIFLDGEYYRQDNSAAASWFDRQATSSEWCQNIHENGAIPPNGSRIEVFFANGRWWTWWVAPNGTSSPDKTFWMNGDIGWTLENPTVEKTGNDRWIRCGGTSLGTGRLAFKPASSSTVSTTTTAVTWDDAEDDYDTNGPIKISETGYYEVAMSVGYDYRRLTGAAGEPSENNPIQLHLALRYENPSLVRDLSIAWSDDPLPGDSHRNWTSAGTGIEDVEANSLEWAAYVSGHKNVKLEAGYWATPIAFAYGPVDYAVVVSGMSMLIRKLPN